MKDKIAKLPKWAQKEIQKLTLQKDEAESLLRNHTDQQKPSPVFYNEWADGKHVRFFIHSNSIFFHHRGIELQVLLAHDSFRLYFNPTHKLRGDIFLEPIAHNSIHLMLCEPTKITEERDPA